MNNSRKFHPVGATRVHPAMTRHGFRVSTMVLALTSAFCMLDTAQAQTSTGQQRADTATSVKKLDDPISWTISTTGPPLGKTAGLYAANGGTIIGMTPSLVITTEGSYGIQNEGGTITLKSGTVTIGTLSDGAWGIYAKNSAALNDIKDVSVETQGVKAHAAFSELGGTTVISGASTLITNGDNAMGARALSAGSISLNGTTIETGGAAAHGIDASGANSRVEVVDATVTTTGDDANGAHSAAAGFISLSGTTIETAGSKAYGLHAEGAKSQIDTVDTTVTTKGDKAVGARASAAGVIGLRRTTIQTGGTDAYGMYAMDANSHVEALDTTVITTGAGAIGARATGGGRVTVDGNSSIETSGDGAHAAYVSGSGNTSVSIGGNATLTTHGSEAVGALTALGKLTLDGTMIMTTGSNSHAVSAEGKNGAALAYASDISVSTEGDGAAGIYALHGGQITLDSGRVETQGDGAAGLRSNAGHALLDAKDTEVITYGAGAYGVYANTASTIDLTRGGVQILTTGGTNDSGKRSYGVFATTTGALIKAEGVDVETQGNGAYGVYADSGGVIELGTGSSIRTAGDAAHGIDANGGTGGGTAQVTAVDGTTITTIGANAYGAYTLNNGAVDLGTGTQIRTSGNSAYGLYAQTGSAGASQIAARDVTIVTGAGDSGTSGTGKSAHGAYVYGNSRMDLGNASITTYGDNAAALRLERSGATLNINDAQTQLETWGKSANGVEVAAGASKIFDGSTGNILPTVVVHGDASAVLAATSSDGAGTASRIVLDGISLDTAMTDMSAGSIYNWGAHAMNGGAIELRNGASSGTTGLWAGAADGTGMASAVVFKDTASGTGSRVRLDTNSLLDISSTTKGLTIGSLEGRGDVFLGSRNLTIGGHTTDADSASTAYAGVISGGGGLTKTGSGTLTIGGQNTYTGMTFIREGNLSASADDVITESSAVVVDARFSVNDTTQNINNLSGEATGRIALGSGSLVAHNDLHAIYAGTLTGSGDFTKAGAATLVLTGTATHTGLTNVSENGALALAAGAQLDGTAGGEIDAGATFGGYGSATGTYANKGTIAVANAMPIFEQQGAGNLTLGSLINTGTIRIGSASGTGNTLTLTGDYTGRNGLIVINTQLGGDDSPTDKLVVQGSTNGTSSIRVVNQNGSGAETNNGIRIVEVWGASAADAFVLSDRVVAGVYEYRLYQGTPTTNDGNWYLRTPVTSKPDPGGKGDGGQDSKPDGGGTGDGGQDSKPDSGGSGDSGQDSKPDPGGKGDAGQDSKPDSGGKDPGNDADTDTDSGQDHGASADGEDADKNGNANDETDDASIPSNDSDDNAAQDDSRPLGPVPEPGAYLANRLVAQSMFVHTLHDRLGEPQYTEHGKQQNDDRVPASWVRVVGSRSNGTAVADGGGFDLKERLTVAQIGGDVARWNDGGDKRWLVGVMAGYGNATTTSRSAGYDDARGHLDGYSFGAYATWYRDDGAQTGPYVDAWLQYAWFDNRIESTTGKQTTFKSRNAAASIEGGWAFLLRESDDSRLLLEPQLQLVHSNYTSGDFVDADGALISAGRGAQLVSRLGGRLFARHTLEDGRLIQPFVELNWWHTDGSPAIRYNGVDVDSTSGGNRYEVKLGAQAEAARNWHIWGHVGAQKGQGDWRRFEGLGGMKYLW